MNKMDSYISQIPRSLLLVGFTILATPALTAAFNVNDADLLGRKIADCANATTVPLNTTIRSFHVSGNEPQCFAAYLPSGALNLDVAVPGQAAAEARITFHGRACEAAGEAKENFAYLERSATSMLLEIRTPGNYFFCVTAQDPTGQLDEIKLRNSFVEGGILTAKGDDPEVTEPPPDPMLFNPGSGLCAATKGDDPEVTEPPPDPKVGDLACKVEAIRKVTCGLGETDDHGDTPFCATPILPGRSSSGEIGNPWRDDDDFFALRLTAMQTVRIETTGDTDTFGGLYDRRGCRIAMDDDGGSGANFRIVKTLSPGLYFVRVEGRGGAEGPYQLNVEAWY